MITNIINEKIFLISFSLFLVLFFIVTYAVSNRIIYQVMPHILGR